MERFKHSPASEVTIAATDNTATEQGRTTGTLTVTRTGGTAASLTVFYSTGGTVTAGSDYQPLSGSVMIPAGQSSATITITPIDDAVIGEGNETVIATLTADAAYTIGAQNNATVTIRKRPGSLPTLTATAYQTSWSFVGVPGCFMILPAARKTAAYGRKRPRLHPCSHGL